MSTFMHQGRWGSNETQEGHGEDGCGGGCGESGRLDWGQSVRGAGLKRGVCSVGGR